MKKDSWIENVGALMEIDEGHFFSTVERGHDCDWGEYTAYFLKELNLTVCIYDDDPSRISLHKEPSQ